MYSWSKDWPTLTELFFGKGKGPSKKYEATLGIPRKTNGMTEEVPKKKVTAKKSAPKTEARGTRKDFGLQKKLKETK